MKKNGFQTVAQSVREHGSIYRVKVAQAPPECRLNGGEIFSFPQILRIFY